MNYPQENAQNQEEKTFFFARYPMQIYCLLALFAACFFTYGLSLFIVLLFSVTVLEMHKKKFGVSFTAGAFCLFVILPNAIFSLLLQLFLLYSAWACLVKNRSERKLLLPILTTAASVLLLVSAYFTFFPSNPREDIGVDYSEGQLIEESDTHGGFLGDGVSYQIYQFPRDSRFEQLMSDSPHWKELPLDRSMTILAWGLEEGTSSYGPWINHDGSPLIPHFERGYSYFYNRYDSPSNTDPYDDSHIFDFPSQNFTAAFYDSDTKYLYLVKYDS